MRRGWGRPNYPPKKRVGEGQHGHAPGGLGRHSLAKSRERRSRLPWVRFVLPLAFRVEKCPLCLYTRVSDRPIRLTVPRFVCFGAQMMSGYRQRYGGYRQLCCVSLSQTEVQCVSSGSRVSPLSVCHSSGFVCTEVARAHE